MTFSVYLREIHPHNIVAGHPCAFQHVEGSDSNTNLIQLKCGFWDDLAVAFVIHLVAIFTGSFCADCRAER